MKEARGNNLGQGKAAREHTLFTGSRASTSIRNPDFGATRGGTGAAVYVLATGQDEALDVEQGRLEGALKALPT
jgi:hypothetical protein